MFFILYHSQSLVPCIIYHSQILVCNFYIYHSEILVMYFDIYQSQNLVPYHYYFRNFSQCQPLQSIIVKMFNIFVKLKQRDSLVV